MKRYVLPALLAVLGVMSVACGGQTAQTSINTIAAATLTAADADLAAVKTYTLDQARQMKAGSAALAATSQSYYDLIAGHNFDYQAAWAADATALTQLVADIKAHWLTASTHYELDEGIIAGVPSLAY